MAQAVLDDGGELRAGNSDVAVARKGSEQDLLFLAQSQVAVREDGLERNGIRVGVRVETLVDDRRVLVAARAAVQVDAFAPPPTQRANSVMGWGVSIDALAPVIPAEGAYDRGNRQTAKF